MKGKFSQLILLISLFAYIRICRGDACYSEANEKYFEEGETLSRIDVCGLLTCRNGHWLSRTCGSAHAPEEDEDDSCVFIEEDRSKPFPECCQAYICPYIE